MEVQPAKMSDTDLYGFYWILSKLPADIKGDGQSQL
jgi:hypothetical protein